MTVGLWAGSAQTDKTPGLFDLGLVESGFQLGLGGVCIAFDQLRFHAFGGRADLDLSRFLGFG